MGETVDFTPALRWHCPDNAATGEPDGDHLELLATIADHVFTLGGIQRTGHTAGHGCCWYEADTDAYGPADVSLLWTVPELVCLLREALPKWAAMIPDVPVDLLALWEAAS